MNEEETIEYLKKRISILHSNYLFASEQKIKEVLNLIEKQKTEIEELEEENNKLKRQIPINFKPSIKETNNGIDWYSPYKKH